MIIYRTTNTVNGKIYIGKVINDRPAYLGSGKALKAAIEKYGKENFCKTIIDNALTHEELCEKERFWIKKSMSNKRKIGYNLTPGGVGGAGPRSLETKRKIGLSSKMRNSGENHPMYGKKHSEETRMKMKQSHTGKHISEETRLKISKAMKKSHRSL